MREADSGLAPPSPPNIGTIVPISGKRRTHAMQTSFVDKNYWEWTIQREIYSAMVRSTTVDAATRAPGVDAWSITAPCGHCGALTVFNLRFSETDSSRRTASASFIPIRCGITYAPSRGPDDTRTSTRGDAAPTPGLGFCISTVSADTSGIVTFETSPT